MPKKESDRIVREEECSRSVNSDSKQETESATDG